MGDVQLPCAEDLHLQLRTRILSSLIFIVEDSVYLPNDSALSEYIENDVGVIYKGAHKQPSGRQWIFGQFDPVVLPACCHILDKSRNLEHYQ